MNKLRRKPDAWLKSLEMDSQRKILVVEGIEDRLLVEYLTDNKLNSSAIILEIDSIDISEKIDGGNKGRLIYLSEIVEQNRSFKIFIDKDYSEFTKTKYKNNVITTDFKDLESYLYEVDFLRKFIKVGLKTERINEKGLLKSISLLRYFGIVRIVSIVNELKLSVNKTNERISKYINIGSDNTFTIEEDRYITSLIQNSNNNIDFATLSELIKKSIEKFAGIHFKEIVHGKDMIALVKILASKINFKKDNIENVLWMSFDNRKLEDYINLSEIVEYLTTG